MRMIIKFIRTTMAPSRTPPRFVSGRLALIALVASVLGSAACATQMPAPSQADATRIAMEWPGTTVETLARGRSAYLGRCTACHAAYRPDSQPAAAWRKIVAEMATRSKLDHRTTDDVVRYLVASARR
jgi:cytochrome c5